MLLARCGLSDAIDAALVAMAIAGDQIIASDCDDLAVLVAVGDRGVEVAPA